MFMSARDGSGMVPLESERSRVELWDHMVDVLKGQYEKNPESQVKKMAKLVDRFDVVDTEIGELEARVDDLLESKGAGDKKYKKLQKQLKKAQEERDALFAEIDNATAALKLKKVVKAKGDASDTGA